VVVKLIQKVPKMTIKKVPIIDVEGMVAGQLFVSLRPCTVSGRDIVNECVERSEELVDLWK